MSCIIYEERIVRQAETSDERSRDETSVTRDKSDTLLLPLSFFFFSRGHVAEKQRKMPLKIFDFREKPARSSRL